MRSQCLHDEGIGNLISRLAELLAVEEPAALQIEQQLAGCLRNFPSQRFVIHGHAR